MSLLKIGVIVIAFGCTACLNSTKIDTQETTSSKKDTRIKSQLSKIDNAFKEGDQKTACDLQINLSKNPENFKDLSPDLLKALQKFQVKCGKQTLSIKLD